MSLGGGIASEPRSSDPRQLRAVGLRAHFETRTRRLPRRFLSTNYRKGSGDDVGPAASYSSSQAPVAAAVAADGSA